MRAQQPGASPSHSPGCRSSWCPAHSPSAAPRAAGPAAGAGGRGRCSPPAMGPRRPRRAASAAARAQRGAGPGPGPGRAPLPAAGGAAPPGSARPPAPLPAGWAPRCCCLALVSLRFWGVFPTGVGDGDGGDRADPGGEREELRAGTNRSLGLKETLGTLRAVLSQEPGHHTDPRPLSSVQPGTETGLGGTPGALPELRSRRGCPGNRAAAVPIVCHGEADDMSHSSHSRRRRSRGKAAAIHGRALPAAAGLCWAPTPRAAPGAQRE